jgi:phosphatidylglycerophosphatase A
VSNKFHINFSIIVSTFFGAGYFPKIPGTFASALALLPLAFVPEQYHTYCFPLVVILCVVCIPLIAKAELQLGNDSSRIVIDEVLAVWLIFTSPYMEFSLASCLFGLVLFRLFDILKPSIIGRINERQGAVYVLLDDVFAALATIVSLHCLLFIAKFIAIYRIITTFAN